MNFFLKKPDIKITCMYSRSICGGNLFAASPRRLLQSALEQGHWKEPHSLPYVHYMCTSICTRTRTLKGATLTPLCALYVHIVLFIPDWPFAHPRCVSWCPDNCCLYTHFGSCLWTLWPCNAHVCVQNVLVMGTTFALQAPNVHNMGPKCVAASSFVWENDWWG